MEEPASSPIIFEDVKMHRQVVLSVLGSYVYFLFFNIPIQRLKRSKLRGSLICTDIKYAFVMLQYGSGNFQVTLQDEEDSHDFQIILTGRIDLMKDQVKTQLRGMREENGRIALEFHFNNIFERAGYQLKDDFDLVDKIKRHSTGTFTFPPLITV